jgi:hypothetical protein
LITELSENVPPSISRDQQWGNIDFDTGLDKRLVFLDLLDLYLGVITVGECFSNSLGERWAVERGKDRPI